MFFPLYRITGLLCIRFAKWLVGLKPGDDKLDMEVWLPPLDVFMVLHTYMLNPKCVCFLFSFLGQNGG